MNEYNSVKRFSWGSTLEIIVKLAMLFIFVNPVAARAEVAREMKWTPTSWAKSVGGLKKLKSLGTPTRIAVIKRNAKIYEAVNFDYEASQQYFLDFLRFEQNQLTFEINKSQGKSRCGQDLRAAATCLNVDLVLDVTRDPWALVSYDQSKNKTKTLIKDRAGEVGRYAEWVAKKMNYDGVLLAREGSYFLALTSPNVIPGETQVLMLTNSSNKILLAPGAQKGAGLLVVKKVEGRFSILEQIVVDEKEQSQFRFGEKIIVERVKAVEQTSENPDKKDPEKEAGSPTPSPAED
jgi:hypothetical protein